MTVFQWLETDLPNGQTVLERLASLANLNGGCLSVGKTTGLRTLEEMLDLTGMVGCLDGFVRASDGRCWGRVQKMLDAEARRQSNSEGTMERATRAMRSKN